MMDKKTIKRQNIVDNIHKNLGFSKNFSDSLINKIFLILIENFKTNKNFKISKFGTFKLLNKNERVGRNPRTGIKAKISARRVVTFKASNYFKNKLNNNKNE